MRQLHDVHTLRAGLSAKIEEEGNDYVSSCLSHVN
jgi:hypothetical protein